MSFTVYGTCYLDWMHVIMHLRYRDTLTLSVATTRHHWSQPSEYFSNNSLATGHHAQSTPDVRNQCDSNQIIACHSNELL